jgi:hypothetical protein
VLAAAIIMSRMKTLRLVALAASLAGMDRSLAHAEVVGNWDFSSGSFASLTGSIGLSELRTKSYYSAFGGQPGIPATEFGSPASFGISGPGGASKTVLRVPNTAGYGPMGGLIAEFPRHVNATANTLNRYTIVMDLLVRQAAYDAVYTRGTRQYVSLFQTAPTSDGDLFIDVRDQPGPEATRPLGVGGVYDGDVTAAQWHRIAWVATLDAPTSEPRFRSYVNGQPAGTLVWDELAVDREFDSVKRDLTDPSRPLEALGVDGRFSIATLGQVSGGNLPDFNTSVFFLFNDNADEVGEVFMAHLQFRDDALSASEILALGGVDGQPITSVPEPASLALAAVGLMTAALIRSYRSRSTTASRAPPSGPGSPA